MIPDETLDRWEAQVKAGRDGSSNVPALIAEVRELRRWKDEALPVISGLQELGRELGLPLGASITGPEAVEKARELLAESALHRYRDDGPCICNTGPGTDGPDECCPYHGRTYSKWVDRADHAEAELARILALITDEHTVETVADAMGDHAEDFFRNGDFLGCVCESDWRTRANRPTITQDPVDYMRRHLARAVLGALAGLIGGEQGGDRRRTLCDHEFSPEQIEELGEDADCIHGCGTFYGEVEA